MGYLLGRGFALEAKRLHIEAAAILGKLRPFLMNANAPLFNLSSLLSFAPSQRQPEVFHRVVIEI